MSDTVENGAENTTENEPKSEKPQKEKPSLFRNYISFAGFAIAAAGLTSFLLLLLMEFYSSFENPYTDLITYIFVPSVLGFGLMIAGVGAFLERRRRRNSPDADIPAFPVLDLNDPARRRKTLVFLVLMFVFLFMSAFGSYRAFEYTESVTFCGQACHSVMKPEFVAYHASPHARVRCVECHVGGGAQAYVKYKFAGMRQLYGVVTGHFNRPIETPVANMRAATETCQACHWSEKYHGDVLRVFNHYSYDEANTLNQTRMLLKVGGGDPNAGPVGGIHWHMNVANEITFISSDDRRQMIPWIRMKDANGKITDFVRKDTNVAELDVEKAPKRKMDCIDCHNRPAHNYLSPNQAVDLALEAGRLDQSLPFIKAKAVEVLAKEYTTNDQAVQTIAQDLGEYYRTAQPQIFASKAASVNGAITEVQRIYQTYFFPEMKTDWKASPNNIGHFNAQGCFRCHDGQHFASDGRVIRNECSVCHTTIDQTFAGKTWTPPNNTFQHPVNLGDRNTWQCAACHQGDKTFKHPLNLGDISKFQCADCHTGKGPKMDLKGI